MEGAFASLRDKEGSLFMPQTALLRLEADRGVRSKSDSVGSRQFLAEWVLLNLLGLEEPCKAGRRCPLVGTDLAAQVRRASLFSCLRVSVHANTFIQMSVTPQAIQQLLDELEVSKQARLRAWEVLQRFRAILCDLGHVAIEPPPKKTFEAEGACLERALTKCLSDREAALKELADAARRVDKAAFGNRGDFGAAHQALLKALDRAGDFI
jgi:hypothetical protein